MRILIPLILVLGSTEAWKRWKGLPGNKITSTCLETYDYGSLQDCVQSCSLCQDCFAFHFNHKTKECCTAAEGFSQSTAEPEYVLHQMITTYNQPRSPMVHTPDPAVKQCPVVHREWTQFAIDGLAEKGTWGIVSSRVPEGIERISIFDNSLDTVFSTISLSNSAVRIFTRQMFRVTSVTVFTGETPLSHLEVRIGYVRELFTPEQELFTRNTRCNYFTGPSNQTNQEIKFDCGSNRGIPGKFLTIQQIGVTAPLEIADINVYGFGRMCDTNREF